MSQAVTAIVSSVVAVYPDHASAERAVRQLHVGGFALDDLSIVGRGSEVTEEPCGLVSRGDYVKAGAESGSLFGGLSGLCIGAGFLVLPGVGLVVVAGPIAAALLAGIEGALAGAALGSIRNPAPTHRPKSPPNNYPLFAPALTKSPRLTKPHGSSVTSEPRPTIESSSSATPATWSCRTARSAATWSG